MRKYILLFISACMVFFSCSKQVEQPWQNSVIYEMNVRQYTPEGTFAAAEKQLPRLQKLGVDIIWLMPIYPIGVKERKGTLGSYYAVSDYCAVNPEFGEMADFDHFLSEAHQMGFKVILDWVANHTSPDAKWIQECPKDWYERDEEGNTIVQYDWTDIAALNYENKAVWKAQEDALHFWMERGIDGFRCDMACEVPLEFWKEAIAGLKAKYPRMYWLAEGENPDLHQISGFNTSYAWELHHLLNAIAQGKKGVEDLVAYIEKDAINTPAEASRLMFTSNHDENSWAGTEFDRMGDAVRAMTVLTFTLPSSQPLIYTGQEMAWNHRFEFFEKDPIPAWEENDQTAFYQKLIQFRHDNPCLAAGTIGGSFEILSTEDNTLIFTRTLPENQVKISVQLEAPWKYQFEVVK